MRLLQRNRVGRRPNLREEGVEAMNLLPLLDIGIILSDAAECKFIHKINFMWSAHMFVLFCIQLVVGGSREYKAHLEIFYNKRESGRKKHDLTGLGEV
jgi:hypothetical protein